MEELKEQEEKKEEFVCHSTGKVLLGAADIEMCKCEQNEVVLNNNLLGSFTADGKYLIDKEFLMDLVKVRKKIVETYENKYVLSAWLDGEFELRFTLIIEALEEFKRVATLRFVEVIVNENDEKELLRTIVARYRDDADSFFLEKVFKVFNIKKPDDNGDDIDEEELLGILRRFKNMKLLRENRLSKLDLISKAYIIELLTIMKRFNGKIPEYFLKKYAEALENLKGLEGKVGYFVKLKVLVDLILRSMTIDDEELRSLIERAKMNYVEAYTAMDRAILEVVPKLTKKKVETKIVSSSGGSKPKKKAKVKKKKAALKPSKAKSVQKKRQLYVENFKINKGRNSNSLEHEKPKDKDFTLTDQEELRREIFGKFVKQGFEAALKLQEKKLQTQRRQRQSQNSEEMQR